MARTKKQATINGKAYDLKKSAYTLNLSPVHVSDSMSGKMLGIPSISTSVLLNTICQARRTVKGSICEKCFAQATVSRYSGLSKNLEENYHLLTESILPEDLLPIFGNVQNVRIESFGDVQNVTQCINYANIAKINPDVTFAWWTKNARIVSEAFDIVGKPENVILIESSEFVNVRKEKSSKYVDKVFTVFSPDFIAAQGVNINCGARSCATCKNCYRMNTEADVREQLK